ncbi:MAG: hypothetical protein ACI9FB_002589 [Candidatus Azotimanducaceae bacterium]
MIRKFLRYFCRLTLIGIAGVTALLVSTPFYVYDQFNQEIPVARLTFEQKADNYFQALLRQGDFCSSQQFEILGDQFQLDAGFVKWKGLGVILGFRPLYRLDRLSGRYSDIVQQNKQNHLAHNLAPDVLFDFFDEDAPGGSSGWLMDTRYGSSVYLNIDPSLSYEVYATEDGLITRAESSVGLSQGNEQLQNGIIPTCAPSTIADWSETLNSLAVSALDSNKL